jgi:hypothetical protein
LWKLVLFQPIVFFDYHLRSRAIVAQAFGTKEGDTNYNPIADLDNNKQISIIDISTVAIDYGKTV